MYVFHYHPLTGAYLGGTPCDFDQKRPGEILVPAWATAKPPLPGALREAGRWPHFVPARNDWEMRSLGGASV